MFHVRGHATFLFIPFGGHKQSSSLIQEALLSEIVVMGTILFITLLIVNVIIFYFGCARKSINQ